jgi:hypothetical protein
LIEGAVKTLRKFERHQRYPDELFAVLRGSLNRAPACEMNARLAIAGEFLRVVVITPLRTYGWRHAFSKFRASSDL